MMYRVKYTGCSAGWIGIVTMILAGTLTNAPCAAQEVFTPEIFERTVSIELDGGPDAVFALFEPSARVEAYGAQVLSAGEPTDSSGMVFWKDHGTMNQYWVVADHDPDGHFIRYVYLEGDYELLVEEIRVSESDGGCEASITWRVWGLHEESGVREYMTDGRFDERMRRLQQGINRRLQE